MLFSTTLPSVSLLRQQIRAHYHCPESELIESLIPLARLDYDASVSAKARAQDLILNMQVAASGMMETLLQEYALSSEEGVVLMCLAEALLRVPDKATRDALIAEKLGQGDWRSHLKSGSAFVRLSTQGLMLSNSLLRPKQQEATFKGLLGKMGAPVIREAMSFAMSLLGGQFITGQTIEQARQHARKQEQKGYRYSYDMLGEGARTQRDADHYFASYQASILALQGDKQDVHASPGISVKLSAIHPRFEVAQKARIMHELVPRLLALAKMARQQNIGLTVDAEEAARLDIALDVFEAVFISDELQGWQGLGIAVQAYQKRALPVIKWLSALAEQASRSINVRLVKGAYWDSEIKLAQEHGLADYPVFTRKQNTDISYQACARALIEASWLYPQFATHNAYTLACIMEMAAERSDYEFQRLHGMGAAMYDPLISGAEAHCRIYAPVGNYSDLLPYLVRRLLENGANTSFVNLVQNKQQDLTALLTDPVDAALVHGVSRNRQIPLPEDLYGEARKNAAGLDIANDNDLQRIDQRLDCWWQHFFERVRSNRNAGSGTEAMTEVRNPANHQQILARIPYHGQTDIAQAISRADGAFDAWASRTPAHRAAVLMGFAELIESQQADLLGLCIKEAGKTLDDAIAEVREAVDFCRYYANQIQQTEHQTGLTPLGTVLCISPWNFPLAIFVGQVAAALVTGNTVVAKPAEQTCLIAQHALHLLYQAGLPPDAVQLVRARGAIVGQVALPDERVKAVMFTGSNATCFHIAQTLAERDEPVPLIAETGGQNCMIVDSTALLEQVVDDVIQSGFKSAGQRCSALRVLYVQDDIADELIRMLSGTMQELQVGDPALLETDIGPLIDDKALKQLERHAARMDNEARLLARIGPKEDLADGFFFAPRLYEITSIAQLPEEVFGPCVHVIRYAGDALEQIVAEINSTGFGLTAGIHSRLSERAHALAAAIQVGNVYINRNMVGAVVGVQPFGGRGLSGTGPKAGGPFYLQRLQSPSDSAPTWRTSWPQRSGVRTATLPCGKLRVWQDQCLQHKERSLRQQFSAICLASKGFSITQDSIGEVFRLAREWLQKPLPLPGPTGEQNELQFESRGWLLFVAEEVEQSYLFNAMLTALLSGNGVLIGFIGERPTWLSKLADSELPVLAQAFDPELLEHKQIKGVLCAPQSPYQVLIQKALSKRKGALLPLIAEPVGMRLLQRVWLEKTITTNTTAIGGNASLMLLDESEHRGEVTLTQGQADIAV